MKLLMTVPLLLLMLLQPLVAAETGNTEVAAMPENSRLKQLLETLESDSARQEFVGNLKTLIAIDARERGVAEDNAAETLSEKLGIANQTRSLMDWYREILSRYNISKSTVAQTGLSLLALLVYCLLIFSYRRLVGALVKKIAEVRVRFGVDHQRFGLYVKILRLVGTVVLAILFIYTLNVIWDVADVSGLVNQTTAVLLGETMDILAVAGLGVLFFELVNGGIEYSIRRANTGSSKRLRTLLPIVRNAVFMVFTVFFTLVILSELGIDIMPLLAGAGILGIAIGFGAQTMVRDFLTGFTIILEDLIQVGDVASLAGKTGLVERITIRKVQLRDFGGTVFTVPFSEISIVENLSKDYSCYVFDVGVAYREDPDQVIELLRECDEQLRTDSSIGPLIMGQLEIFGVDRFADSAVIIKARYRTLPLKQWDVGRAFNRLMKIKFDEHNIEIPFPHRTLYFGEDRQGKAPAGNIRLQQAPLS